MWKKKIRKTIPSHGLLTNTVNSANVPSSSELSRNTKTVRDHDEHTSTISPEFLPFSNYVRRNYEKRTERSRFANGTCSAPVKIDSFHAKKRSQTKHTHTNKTHHCKTNIHILQLFSRWIWNVQYYVWNAERNFAITSSPNSIGNARVSNLNSRSNVFLQPYQIE